MLAAVAGLEGCAQACPAALLEGVLSREGDDLVVVIDDGAVEHVDWLASNHRVGDRGGTLVVSDWLRMIAAQEGDFVRLGGGEASTGTWNVCGMFEVGEPPS